QRKRLSGQPPAVASAHQPEARSLMVPVEEEERAQPSRVVDSQPRTVRVRQLEPGGFARWDAFVDECPDATFFHRAGWKRVLETGLGHQTFYLYAENAAGAIVGVLPLVFIRSVLFGRSLSSTAFCVYGGPAVVAAPVADALTARALEIAERLRVGHLEYR